MSRFSKASFWLVFALVAFIAATLRSHLDGDGAEYLAMAHAFTVHGTASLSAADFSHVAHILDGKMDPAAHKLFAGVVSQLDSIPAGQPYFGFARTASGEMYSIHFWMYSLMAAPFYAVVSWLGVQPTLCFSLLNLALSGATVMHLHRSLPGARRAAALVFLVLGTAYYLRWTGPEVLSACCAFSASICALRRDTSMAILLCGIGATQNPSLALLIPMFAAHRAVSLKVPAIATLPLVRRGALAEACLAGAGMIMALAPYVFYYSAFGIPSLIAPYFTDPAFITPQRAWSFLFDLDQGMLAGIPGLFIGLAAVAAASPVMKRSALAGNGLFSLFACCVLAAPALAALNWNSGTSIMLRYAYWAAMPLVAFFVSTLPALSPGLRMPITSAVVAAQFLAVLGSGLMFRTTSYLHHTPLAEWVFATFPGLANPDPEIFIERGQHSEAHFTIKTTQVFYDKGVPVKLLRHWTNSNDSAGLCPEGAQVSAQSVADVDRGWQYLNAPLECVPAGLRSASMQLHFTATGDSRGSLGGGWATPEQAGTWTNAKRSVIRVRVPMGSVVTDVHFAGHYFDRVRASEVHINGKPVGMHSLTGTQLAVPSGLSGNELVIELLHTDAASPAQRGLSADTRMLAYYLREVHLRLRPRPGNDIPAGAQVGTPPRPM